VSGTGIRDSWFGIRDAGDSALLLELEGVIDPAVNARVIGIAAAIAGKGLTGVRDVIPTYRSVAVHFDPLAADHAVLTEVMREAADAAPAAREGAVVEVPVSYGGEDGPDLPDVAAFAGLSVQHVIERHSSMEYRVFMLGFLPGFAYMGSVDDTIAAPRKATPRTRVPAGSVGIAGRQTGIYPRQSPGGWQLIGRTSLPVFDPSRDPASIFAPGDRVRFVPISGIRDPGSEIRNPGSGIRNQGSGIDSQKSTRIPDPGSRIPIGRRSITVLRPGLFTTIQDTGRWGHQDRGVPVAGPMDTISHRVANALVGNADDAAALEATLVGPELRFDQATVVAIAGADLSASIDGAPLPLNTPRSCAAGAVLRFGERRCGARVYIACDGGIAVPPVLGSRATHVISGLGGIDGRALAAGDRLPLGEIIRGPSQLRRGPFGSADQGGARLRVMPGPQDDWFDEAAFEILQRSRFAIAPQSDRMGYRLNGTPIPRRAGPSGPAGTSPFGAAGDMISDAAFTGGLQVPPSGHPILLMADRQTTGGYPQIATVVTADLPLAGQLLPGDWVEFELCTRQQAIAALVAQEGWLSAAG
jgi:KipI family sensor histidine kinase inhibitor